MAKAKYGTKQAFLEDMLDEASWLITHADSLEFHKRSLEAEAEWLRAAHCEVNVACLLEAAGEGLEAAIHRFSAASCFAKARRYADAVTLAHSALAFSLKDSHRSEIEGFSKKWLAKAAKQIRRPTKKRAIVTH